MGAQAAHQILISPMSQVYTLFFGVVLEQVSVTFATADVHRSHEIFKEQLLNRVPISTSPLHERFELSFRAETEKCVLVEDVEEE